MAEQLFQIGVKALIRDTSGKILLEGKRRTSGVVSYDFPGGRVDEGEDFKQALARELQEEIGLSQVGDITHIATTLTKIHPKVGDSVVQLAIILYAITYNPAHTIELGTDQYSYKWATPEEASKLIQFKYTADFCELIATL